MCGEGKPDTFDFLGFAHICGRNKKTGYFMVKRNTLKKQMRAKLQAIKAELQRRMHEPGRAYWRMACTGSSRLLSVPCGSRQPG
jgi:RNA-directed DNA polymerase